MSRSHFGSVLLLVALALSGAGCGPSDPELRPDAFLRDSLGLDEDDRVHRVRLSSVENQERVEPVRITVRPGDHVEFVTQDRLVHSVGFVLDGLAPASLDFLRATGQEGSPPLVHLGARFVVTFTGAPTGAYPYVVTGNGREVRGTVVVADVD